MALRGSRACEHNPGITHSQKALLLNRLQQPNQAGRWTAMSRLQNTSASLWRNWTIPSNMGVPQARGQHALENTWNVLWAEMPRGWCTQQNVQETRDLDLRFVWVGNNKGWHLVFSSQSNRATQKRTPQKIKAMQFGTTGSLLQMRCSLRQSSLLVKLQDYAKSNTVLYYSSCFLLTYMYMYISVYIYTYMKWRFMMTGEYNKFLKSRLICS